MNISMKGTVQIILKFWRLSKKHNVMNKCHSRSENKWRIKIILHTVYQWDAEYCDYIIIHLYFQLDDINGPDAPYLVLIIDVSYIFAFSYSRKNSKSVLRDSAHPITRDQVNVIVCNDGFLSTLICVMTCIEDDNCYMRLTFLKKI